VTVLTDTGTLLVCLLVRVGLVLRSAVDMGHVLMVLVVVVHVIVLETGTPVVTVLTACQGTMGRPVTHVQQ
jgi:hypothetical protein